MSDACPPVSASVLINLISHKFNNFGFAAPHQLALNQDTYPEMALQRNEFEVK